MASSDRQAPFVILGETEPFHFEKNWLKFEEKLQRKTRIDLGQSELTCNWQNLAFCVDFFSYSQKFSNDAFIGEIRTLILGESEFESKKDRILFQLDVQGLHFKEKIDFQCEMPSYCQRHGDLAFDLLTESGFSEGQFFWMSGNF